MTDTVLPENRCVHVDDTGQRCNEPFTGYYFSRMQRRITPEWYVRQCAAFGNDVLCNRHLLQFLREQLAQELRKQIQMN